MKIVVCVKQVPGTTKVRMDPSTNTIIRDAKQSIVNPFDTFAIEEAVRLGEMAGAETIALSMGIPATETLLRDASARGIDRGMLLSDRAFAGADTLATSETLAMGIRRIGGVDLVLCGKMAVDGDTGQIGPELAEKLGVPHVTDVCDIRTVLDGEITLVRQTDTGRDTLRVRLPAVLTVVKDINTPRMPTIAGIRYAKEAPFEVCGAGMLGANPGKVGLAGSPTQVVRTFVPVRDAQSVPVTGSASEQVDTLCGILKEVL